MLGRSRPVARQADLSHRYDRHAKRPVGNVGMCRIGTARVHGVLQLWIAGCVRDRIAGVRSQVAVQSCADTGPVVLVHLSQCDAQAGHRGMSSCDPSARVFLYLQHHGLATHHGVRNGQADRDNRQHQQQRNASTVSWSVGAV